MILVEPLLALVRPVELRRDRTGYGMRLRLCRPARGGLSGSGRGVHCSQWLKEDHLTVEYAQFPFDVK